MGSESFGTPQTQMGTGGRTLRQENTRDVERLGAKRCAPTASQLPESADLRLLKGSPGNLAPLKPTQSSGQLLQHPTALPMSTLLCQSSKNNPVLLTGRKEKQPQAPELQDES